MSSVTAAAGWWWRAVPLVATVVLLVVLMQVAAGAAPPTQPSVCPSRALSRVPPSTWRVAHLELVPGGPVALRLCRYTGLNEPLARSRIVNQQCSLHTWHRSSTRCRRSRAAIRHIAHPTMARR